MKTKQKKSFNRIFSPNLDILKEKISSLKFLKLIFEKNFAGLG